MAKMEGIELAQSHICWLFCLTEGLAPVILITVLDNLRSCTISGGWILQFPSEHCGIQILNLTPAAGC